MPLWARTEAPSLRARTQEGRPACTVRPAVRGPAACRTEQSRPTGSPPADAAPVPHPTHAGCGHPGGAAGASPGASPHTTGPGRRVSVGSSAIHESSVVKELLGLWPALALVVGFPRARGPPSPGPPRTLVASPEPRPSFSSCCVSPV